MTRPWTRSGAWVATRRLTLAPRETPPTTALLDPEVVEQCHHVFGVGVHAVEGRPFRLLRPAVAGQVEEDHPMAGSGQVDGQPAIHVGVHQDPVHEHQDPRSVPVDLVVQLHPVGIEHADLEWRRRR